MIESDSGRMAAGSAFHNGYPVGALAVTHAEAAFLPIDQRVEPLQKRDSQNQIWKHGGYSQREVEAYGVHHHVDVRKFGAMDLGTGGTSESLARVQTVAL